MYAVSLYDVFFKRNFKGKKVISYNEQGRRFF